MKTTKKIPSSKPVSKTSTGKPIYEKVPKKEVPAIKKITAEETLPIELRKNKHTYKLIKRTKEVAMYSQHVDVDGPIVAYEVFLVGWKNGAAINGLTIKPGEKFPSDAAFGSTAWACGDLERAEIRYQEFLESVELKNKKKKNGEKK